MNLPNSGSPLKGLTPAQLWPLLQLPGYCAPLWLAFALSSVLAALSWRLQSAVPSAATLNAVLSAAFFLAALFPCEIWAAASRQVRAAQQGAAKLARGGGLVVSSMLCALSLATAPLALLLAYDPHAAWIALSPLDIEQVDISYFDFLLLMLPLAGSVMVLLSMAQLLALRAMLGRTLGTAAWLGLGVLLHAQAGAPWVSGKLPLTFATFAQLAIDQLTNPDLLQSDQVFGPLYGWLFLLLLGALLLLLVCSLGGQRERPTAPPPLLLSLACGALAMTLRSAQSAQRWIADPSLLVPDSLAGLVACFLAVAIPVWALLTVLQPPRAARLDGVFWLQLLALGCLLLVQALPITHDAQLDWAQFGVVLAYAMLILLLLPALAAALPRLLHFACGMPCWPGAAQAALLLAASALLLPLLSLIPANAPAVPSALEELAAGIGLAAARPNVITSLLAGLVCVLALHLAVRPRRWRLRGNPAPKAAA